jgi:hypothetical protein
MSTTPLTPPASEAPAAPAAPAGIQPPAPGSPLGVVPPAPVEGEAVAPTETETEGKPPEGEAPAPVEYKFDLPEGIEIPEEALTSFKGLAAEAKLTPESAAKFMEMHTGALKQTVETIANAQEKAWNDTIEGWKNEFEADPVFGGDKKAETLTAIGKALDEYGSPEARQAFDVTGAGWNPHIVRFVAKMAKALSEGSPLPAGAPTPQQGKTLGAKFYNTGS